MGYRKSIFARGIGSALLLGFACLAVPSQGAFAQIEHELPLFMSAADMLGRQGFVRVINRSDRAGTVRIHAIDDSGRRFGPVDLSLAANATAHFNSDDLEQGNPAKGMSGNTGSGEGNWRLKLATDLDIEALAYIRTLSDGFLTSMHDIVQNESMRWYVPIFNPGSNPNQRSILRLINPSGIDTEVVIEGLDDQGESVSGDAVRFTLPGDASRTLDAQEIEAGYSASTSDFEFDGRLGDGVGKWQLFVSADRPIRVMSLMATPTGHLTNLSSVMGDDILRGSAGNDTLYGGNGNDVISPGDSDFSADGGGDEVFGSAGNDRIIYTDSTGRRATQRLRYSGLESGGITATIDGVANRATVNKGSTGTDTLVDIINPLRLSTGFLLFGTGAADIFHITLDANQWLLAQGGAGGDTFDIRADLDTTAWVRIDYADAPAGIDVDLNADRARNDGFGDVDVIRGDVWEVGGSNFSDAIRGSDNAESFVGRGGDDVIDGRGGIDRLRFLPAHVGAIDVDLSAGTATGTWDGAAFSYAISNIEQVQGEGGNDTLGGSAGGDTLEGRGGNDTLLGREGGDTLDGGDGDDVINPGSNTLSVGIDRIWASAGDDQIVYTDSTGPTAYQNLSYSRLEDTGITVRIDGRANTATIAKGSAGTDTLVDVANALDENRGFSLEGTHSDDVFHLALANAQWMEVQAKAGNDTFHIGSDGAVRINYADARHGIDVDLQVGRARDDGFGDVDTINGPVGELVGSDFSDIIRGSGGDESIRGGAGNDTMDGGGGSDLLRYDFPGARSVDVDLEAGIATGTWGNGYFVDTISNFERVRGSNGDDTLRGSVRDEQFAGRRGRDTFVFGAGHGNDTITDFIDGEDRIDLNALGVSENDVMSAASSTGSGGTLVDLTGHGGGTITLSNFPHGSLDGSDLLI